MEEVLQFYCSDDINKLMAGKKDHITIRESGEKKQIQKRVILCNFKEAYCDYKEYKPDLKRSFLKFALLRPKHCVFAGASKNYSLCTSSIHQDFK